ncbi:MAG: hypothetical protein E6K72_12380, partial [Candidatus Eisenbacteria bacterium]
AVTSAARGTARGPARSDGGRWRRSRPSGSKPTASRRVGTEAVPRAAEPRPPEPRHASPRTHPRRRGRARVARPSRAAQCALGRAAGRDRRDPARARARSRSASFEENLADAKRLAGLFAGVADFPKPVVARVHGNVLGGGVGLVCACDVVVASDDARFGLTEVRLGILPAIISPYVIRRLGDARARELMLTGERFDAAVAERVRLVHHVVPGAELDAKVDERVQGLLAGAPHAQTRIKMLLELWGEVGWEEYRAALPRTLAEVRSGDEAREGLTAFFEKRKPGWQAKP